VKRLLDIFDLWVIFADRKNNLKRMIMVCILAPFFVFYLQQIKPYFKLRPLKGYFIPNSVYNKPSTEGWFSGEYQRTTNDYLNENFGFRNFFVRLNNELRFILFKKAQAAGVIVGKENYVYEVGYIDTYHGAFFLGEKALNDTISNIKWLQDTLKTFGKELLVVIAPSKARVYPEYIPDYFVKAPDARTNYDYFVGQFKRLGVQYIDFNSLFLEKKKTSEYLLFPKLGIHWSRLEAVKAADTIINYLGLLSNTDLPKIRMSDIKVLDTLQAPDNDIIDGMNVLFWPSYPKMAYPTHVNIDSTNKTKRNLLVIADSYWWDIYLRDIPKNVFKNNEFWYYNNEIYCNNQLGKSNTSQIDIKRHILQSDYIILMCTESNLSRLGFGFIGNAKKVLRTPIKPTQRETDDIIEVIRNTPSWHEQVKEKAAKRNISVDSMMILDADWYFQRRGPVKKAISVEGIKEFIKGDANWSREVASKAADKKISVDSMMTLDALWYITAIMKTTPTEKEPELTLSSVKESIYHNNEWMQDIRKKAAARGISVDSMMTLDAIWYMENKK
jgi:hypothetical protein